MKPTHALLNPDGSFAAYVFPEGYDPALLVVLPVGFWSAPNLAVAKANKWEQVKAKREAVSKLAPTPFGVAQADDVSKLNLAGLVQMASFAKAAGAAFSQSFTMADNTRVAMTADEMIVFGVAVGEHIGAAHDFSQSLREQIDAATSLEALAIIDAEGGWPNS
jgi:hypothetical protein